MWYAFGAAQWRGLTYRYAEHVTGFARDPERSEGRAEGHAIARAGLRGSVMHQPESAYLLHMLMRIKVLRAVLIIPIAL